MRKNATRWAAIVAVTLALSVGLGGLVRADEAGDEQSVALFQEGITYFQTGEYVKAREAFDKVLATNPGMQAALRMRQSVELGVLFEMAQKDQLGAQAEQLLDIITRGAREARREVTDPDKLVAGLQSGDTKEYTDALLALSMHGPYAVPYLIPLLEDETPENQHMVTRTLALLCDMHRDACLPLIQVLRGSDPPLLKTRVASVLGVIGDTRALPALMAVQEDETSDETVRMSALAAAQSVTGKMIMDLGSATGQYVEQALAYLYEDAAVVGYTYGTGSDIWRWRGDAESPGERLANEVVPAYLYYQMMAAEAALEGLALAPGDPVLQAILGASLTRQLALCERLKEGQPEAAARVQELATQLPVVLRTLGAPAMAGALRLTLAAPDAEASLYLVRNLAAVLAVEPPPRDEGVIDGLVRALDSDSSEVRYNAALALVRSCPCGGCEPTDEIMRVVSVSLRLLVEHKGLVLIPDFQVRNTLIGLLREAGLDAVPTPADQVSIQSVLALEPSINVVFLSAELPPEVFGAALELVRNDPRTKSAPVCVVFGRQGGPADATMLEGIEQELSGDDLRTDTVLPIVQKALAEAVVPFGEAEQAMVLKAAAAVAELVPSQTRYPLDMVEASLAKVVQGYGDEVSAAAIAALAAVGTGTSVEPLAAVVAGEASTELKVAACRALNAVMRRTGVGASEGVVATLEAALAAEEQSLREAACEALNAAGLAPERLVELVRTAGLGRQ